MVSFTGQDALWRRKQAKEGDLDETRKREDLEDTMKAWVTDSARVKLVKMGGWEDSEESLTAEFSLEIPDFASSTVRRLLSPATVFRTHRLLQDAVQHPTGLPLLLQLRVGGGRRHRHSPAGRHGNRGVAGVRHEGNGQGPVPKFLRETTKGPAHEAFPGH